MKEKITTTKSVINFINQYSNQVYTRGRLFAFIPFWLELTDSNSVVIHSLGNLPKDLVNFIEQERKHLTEVDNVRQSFPLQKKDCFKKKGLKQLKIVNEKLYNESMDGVKWNEVELNINVTLKSNKDLSDVLDSIRFLRHGAPKTLKNTENKPNQ